jgi:mRNA interferase MazF
VDFDPVEGHEQAGRRPALILSVDIFNASAADLVTVLPITTKPRAVRTRIEIVPPEGGLSSSSFVIGEQVRTVSKRRVARRVGAVTAATMAKVEDVVRMVLGL